MINPELRSFGRSWRDADDFSKPWASLFQGMWAWGRSHASLPWPAPSRHPWTSPSCPSLQMPWSSDGPPSKVTHTNQGCPQIHHVFSVSHRPLVGVRPSLHTPSSGESTKHTKQHALSREDKRQIRSSLGIDGQAAEISVGAMFKECVEYAESLCGNDWPRFVQAWLRFSYQQGQKGNGQRLRRCCEQAVLCARLKSARRVR